VTDLSPAVGANGQICGTPASFDAFSVVEREVDDFKREKTFSFKREKGGGDAYLTAVLRNAMVGAKLRKHNTGRTRRLGGGQGELRLRGIIGQRDWF